MNPDSETHASSRPPCRAGRASTPTGFSQTFSSLQEKDFLRLWLGLQVMSLATQMQMIARTFLVYELTGSARILGLVGASIAIPLFSLGLFGGAIADRMERKVLVQGGQLGIAAVALVVATLIASGTVTWVHLLIASLLQGTMWSVLMPARQAIIPELVSRTNLTNAMALTSGGKSLTTLVASAVGGVLYAVIGPEGVYYVVGGLALLAVALTASIQTETGPTARPQANILSDVKAGLSYLKGQHLVLVVLAVGMITALLASPVVYILPTFVVDVYGRDSEAFGLLISMLGLGALIGSITVAMIGPRRRGLLLLAGGLFATAALALIASVPLYYPAALFMTLLGIGSVAHQMLSNTLIMELVEGQFRGRVISVFSIGQGLMPLGLLPLGVAVDLLGNRVAVGILAAVLFAVSATTLLTQTQLRRLD